MKKELWFVGIMTALVLLFFTMAGARADADDYRHRLEMESLLREQNDLLRRQTEAMEEANHRVRDREFWDSLNSPAARECTVTAYGNLECKR